MVPAELIRNAKRLFAKPASRRTYAWSPERRRYVRYPCRWLIRFIELKPQPLEKFHIGKCKNVSQGGIKITSFQPLERHTPILVEMDANLLAKHVEVSELLWIGKNRFLAEVMWRHLNLETRLFEAGIQFVQARKHHQYESLIKYAETL